MFQFTRPRGARRLDLDHKRAPVLVSIHAPARGATAVENLDKTGAPVSIHAPARGATQAAGDRTPLRSFNSRAREGRDLGDDGLLDLGGVSIHAPARGATGATNSDLTLQHVSIHAPARGATAHVLGGRHEDQFQFTRPRGARRRVRRVRGVHARFNSRAREGRDIRWSA